MDVICKKCGSVNDYRIEKRAKNNCAFCNGCDHFIKNIPYKSQTILYFGKYKGMDILEMTDIPYMKWLYENASSLKEHQKKALNDRMDFLKNEGQ